MSGPPRNRDDYERSQRLQAEVRNVLHAFAARPHSALMRPLTAEEVRRSIPEAVLLALSRRPGRLPETRTIAWQMQQIHEEHEALRREALRSMRCKC